MTDRQPDASLEDIRREIDSIDDAILGLLNRRFEATRRVRARKSTDGSLAMSPLRPAREAMMMRRMLASRPTALSPHLVVRLWRVILSASAEMQAPVTVHVAPPVAGDIDARLLIASHFNGIAVSCHRDAATAFAKLEQSRGDLLVVATESDWAEVFAGLASASPQIIATLPIVGHAKIPALLVFGHAEPQSSGHDQTIMLSRGPVPDHIEKALWSIQSGAWTVTSLSGFRDPGEIMQEGSECGPAGIRIAGRCPRAIEVEK
jgi:chorismate mutase/prephenate dehydratase